jgi:hypothetical protein
MWFSLFQSVSFRMLSVERINFPADNEDVSRQFINWPKPFKEYVEGE